MVEVLRKAGHQVRATDLANAYVKDDLVHGRFPSVLKSSGVEFVASDMTDPESLLRVLQGVDYIFHIAAIFSYSAPYDLLYRVNAEGQRHLCEAILAGGGVKRMVVWAAGGIYRPTPDELPIRESDPKRPHNNYLLSKWEQEKVVRDYGERHKLPYTIIRGTTVYGPRCIYGAGQMLKTFNKQKTVAVPKNFISRVPFIHVRDFCRAALHLAGLPEAQGEDYNINDDSQWTTIEVAQFFAKTLGRKFRTLPAIPIPAIRFVLRIGAFFSKLISRITKKPPGLEKDTINYLGLDIVYDNAKLKKTGFRFEYPTPEQGLDEMIAWYRQQLLI